jgi:hypothetical protein
MPSFGAASEQEEAAQRDQRRGRFVAHCPGDVAAEDQPDAAGHAAQRVHQPQVVGRRVQVDRWQTEDGQQARHHQADRGDAGEGTMAVAVFLQVPPDVEPSLGAGVGQRRFRRRTAHAAPATMASIMAIIITTIMIVVADEPSIMAVGDLHLRPTTCCVCPPGACQQRVGLRGVASSLTQ